MRILMIAGVAGKAEAGAAGVVFNITKELRNLGHIVKPIFFEDLLAKQSWPARFRTIEFARAVANYVGKVKNDYDIINIYAPFGFLYGFARRRRGEQAGPPYVMTMHGIEERRNYAMGEEAKKGRADYFRWRTRVWQNFYHMRTYRWSITTADQCIVTNREALLILQLDYKLPPDRVWFSANGVGEEYFHQRSFSDSPDIKLLFVGTWIDHKGIYPLKVGERRCAYAAVRSCTTRTSHAPRSRTSTNCTSRSGSRRSTSPPADRTRPGWKRPSGRAARR